jgi:nucleotide-binding universal stress UspA family protein
MASIILVPLDGSATAEQGLSAACRIASDTGATILLVRAVLYFGVGGDLRSDESVELREAIAYLDTLRQELEQKGLIVMTELLPCPAVRAILFAAEAHHVDLISLCSHGTSGIRHALLGSVAEEVVRRSAVPVLLTRASAPAAPHVAMPYHTILVALDGTPFAETALTYLLGAGIGSAAQVHLLAVLPHVNAPLSDDQVRMHACRVASEAYLQGVGARLLAQRTWCTQVATGIASEQIQLAAERNGVELIVIATQGQQGWHRLLHDNVADQLIHHSTTPLLILREVSQE